MYSVCGCGGGGGLKCAVDHILQEFYTLTRFRTYKIASPPLTKMTTKDVIKRFVSLNFLRPWIEPRTVATVRLLAPLTMPEQI